jgi:hypothetical protein
MRQKDSLRKLAQELGFPASFAATLSDVLRGKCGKLTLDGENALRRALGLNVIAERVTAACPTCGVVHGAGWDCRGAHVQLVRRNPPRVRALNDYLPDVLAWKLRNREICG